MKKNIKQQKSFDYDLIPIGYYDKIFKKRRGMQSKWHHIHYNLIKKIMGSYNKHLDIACAGGTFIGMLDQNKKSVGIDISSKQINYAKKKYQTKNHKFLLMKKNIIKFQKNLFDVVTSLQLIEHLTIEENIKLFKEIHKVLKKRGKLIITTPNYASPWILVEKLVNCFGKVRYDEQHITFFKKKKLIKMLEQIGFKDIKITTNMSFAPFSVLLGWKFSDFLQKIEDKYLNNSYRLFLVSICKK